MEILLIARRRRSTGRVLFRITCVQMLSIVGKLRMQRLVIVRIRRLSALMLGHHEQGNWGDGCGIGEIGIPYEVFGVVASWRVIGK
jgi:hypothetical protein